MFYKYISKKLENGEAKIGLTALNADKEEIYIEGKGLVGFVKSFLTKEEKQQLKNLFLAKLRKENSKHVMGNVSLEDYQ